MATSYMNTCVEYIQEFTAGYEMRKPESYAEFEHSGCKVVILKKHGVDQKDDNRVFGALVEGIYPTRIETRTIFPCVYDLDYISEKAKKEAEWMKPL